MKIADCGLDGIVHSVDLENGFEHQASCSLYIVQAHSDSKKLYIVHTNVFQREVNDFLSWCLRPIGELNMQVVDYKLSKLDCF